MSNFWNTPQKQRQGFGASCSVLLCYLHPSKLIYDRYPNKENRDTLVGIMITQIDIIRVDRREQLCIFMKHKDSGYHELKCIQKLIRFIIEGSETRVFKDSKEKNYWEEVAVKSYACETPIHATTQEEINDILSDGYKADDDRLPGPEKKIYK